MTTQRDDTDSTNFRCFMAEICISLFFFASNSKLSQLLITAYAANTSRIQTNFDSNVAIRTFETVLASKSLCQNTNLYKQFTLLPSLAKRGKGWGWGMLSLRATNQTQREFLFNNGIQSQNLFSASSPPRQKTNFLKPRRQTSLSLRSGERVGVRGYFAPPKAKGQPNQTDLRF
jgi:hypothetical protein